MVVRTPGPQLHADVPVQALAAEDALRAAGMDVPAGSVAFRLSDSFAGIAPGSEYPTILSGHQVRVGKTFSISGAGGPIEALPFRQLHGAGETLGFRFGGLAYSPDVSDLPEESLDQLKNLDIWIVDALRYTLHPSHFSVEQALDWIARVRPKRAVLTHMHVDLDYTALAEKLPPGVEPAYDGMVLTAGA